jgi:transposase InsO family protein
VEVGLHRIRRLRKKLGLRRKQKRKFKATTDSKHNLPIAPNLLDQKFTTEAPDQVWTGDPTYIATDERWLYLASMSRRGICFDNAPIESFWGTLKNELIHHRRYTTHEQARREIAEYIDLFYNRQRRQARLGYLSPAALMQRYLQRNAA